MPNVAPPLASHSPSSLTCPGCGAPASPSDAACRYCDRALSSVACAHCFDRLFAGMQYCSGCGARSNVGTLDADANSLACPGCGDHNCTSLLAERRVGAHQLSECLACHGIWLSTEIVDAITTDANARALFAPDAAQTPTENSSSHAAKASGHGTAFRYRRCPVCAKLMARVNIARISGVVVDRCPKHGTFFDIDELHRLVRFLEAGGLDRARSREREALADERRRLQLLMNLDQRRRALEYARTEGMPETSVTSLLTTLLRKVVE